MKILVYGQVDGKPINMKAVSEAVILAKKIIDEDDLDNAQVLKDAWAGLVRDERLEANKLLDDYAPDSRKKYKTLLCDYLEYKNADNY